MQKIVDNLPEIRVYLRQPEGNDARLTVDVMIFREEEPLGSEETRSLLESRLGVYLLLDGRPAGIAVPSSGGKNGLFQARLETEAISPGKHRLEADLYMNGSVPQRLVSRSSALEFEWPALATSLAGAREESAARSAIAPESTGKSQEEFVAPGKDASAEPAGETASGISMDTKNETKTEDEEWRDALRKELFQELRTEISRLEARQNEQAAAIETLKQTAVSAPASSTPPAKVPPTPPPLTPAPVAAPPGELSPPVATSPAASPPATPRTESPSVRAEQLFAEFLEPADIAVCGNAPLEIRARLVLAGRPLLENEFTALGSPPGPLMLFHKEREIARLEKIADREVLYKGKIEPGVLSPGMEILTAGFRVPADSPFARVRGVLPCLADPLPPAVFGIQPSGKIPRGAKVREIFLQAGDLHSGLDRNRTRVLLNGVVLANPEERADGLLYSLPEESAPGEYSVQAKVYDRAGNETVFESSFTVPEPFQESKPLRLEEYRELRVSESEREEVRDKQKKLYRERLLMAAGWGREFGLPLETPHFEFNHEDWKNLMQLESLVEFYLNYTEPYQSAPFIRGLNKPRLPEEEGYIKVDLRKRPEPSEQVRAVHARASEPGRAYPFPGCRLVIVDSFGGRFSGANARLMENSSRLNIELMDPPNQASLEKINPDFDCLRLSPARDLLAGEANYEKRVFRLRRRLESGQNAFGLDRPLPESFGAGPFRWSVNGGVSDSLQPRLHYNLSRSAHGYDHYDGVVFVVYEGEIVYRQRISSLTSRRSDPLEVNGGSVKGNERYFFQSHRAAGNFINYSFTITGEPGYSNEQTSIPARKYFARKPVDSRQWNLFIHYGYYEANRTGSAGCFTSPKYYQLRDKLLELYQNRFREANEGKLDPAAEMLRGKGHAASQAIRRENRIPLEDWWMKIWGDLIVIHPDERPAL